MAALTATAAEARTSFSRIASAVCESGQQVTVFRNSKPWVVIAPAECESAENIELVRSGILDGRQAIADGEGIEGTQALRDAVNSLRAWHG